MNTQGVGRNPWIRRFHPATDADRALVCFPHAGGCASSYLAFSTALSPAVDVLAVQYPGRQDRIDEACVDSIAELADAVTAELRPWADRPLMLFGHSMGATVAFEVALRLERAGIVPLTVFVSGRAAPSTQRTQEAERGDAELVAELKALGGTDATVLEDEEVLQLALPAIRGDFRAVARYRYAGAPPLRAPVQAHVGLDDPRVTVEEARAWADHTSGGFALHTYPGGHFYLDEHAPRVIGAIAGTSSPSVRRGGGPLGGRSS
ncbi:thioesterase II family protein [Streptomyces sp. NPDC059176]|uniref:thioesterase II family protein n=1 Tax=unclassified Streptomyces TaxID=2593676 RepID=UPI00367D9C99